MQTKSAKTSPEAGGELSKMNRRRTASKETSWVPSAIPFFLFGFIYYLLSPALVIQFLSDENDLLHVATEYLDSSYFDVFYYLDTIFILASFLLGYFLAKLVTNERSSVLDYGSSQTSVPLLLATTFGVLIVYFSLVAYSSGTGFFTGYSTYNILVLGSFSTCAFVSAWFVNYFSKKQVSLIFLSFLVFSSVLLLGWGSRMFFVLSFTALILGLVSKNRKLLKTLWLYGFVTIFCLLIVVVGITREGGGDLGGDRLIGIFFAEPLFTSITGSLYLEYSGGRPVYGVPYDLYASIIHFIPSAVFPGKIEIIGEITRNQDVVSPFGAKALIVSLYSNFGFFYPIFIASIGFYYGFLHKKARKSIFYRATYLSALPILLFLFYRESLVTVIKVLFFNGLIIPFCVSLFLIWISPRTIAEIKRRIPYNGVGGYAARNTLVRQPDPRDPETSRVRQPGSGLV